MARRERTDPADVPGGGRAILGLILATLAFMVCFAVWGLIAPVAPTFRELYGLSGSQVGLLVAVPVLLGSLAPHTPGHLR